MNAIAAIVHALLHIEKPVAVAVRCHSVGGHYKILVNKVSSTTRICHHGNSNGNCMNAVLANKQYYDQHKDVRVISFSETSILICKGTSSINSF